MPGAERLLVPLDSVIDFKREVYQHALTELARYRFRGQVASLFHGNRIALTACA